jgi:hypothetical protein
VPVLAFILAWRPKYFLIFIPVVIVLAIIKPRWGVKR